MLVDGVFYIFWSSNFWQIYNFNGQEAVMQNMKYLVRRNVCYRFRERRNIYIWCKIKITTVIRVVATDFTIFVRSVTVAVLEKSKKEQSKPSLSWESNSFINLEGMEITRNI